MIVPGPKLVELLQTEAAVKLYEQINERLEPQEWGWLMFGLLEIEEELNGKELFI